MTESENMEEYRIYSITEGSKELCDTACNSYVLGSRR